MIRDKDLLGFIFEILASSTVIRVHRVLKEMYFLK